LRGFLLDENLSEVIGEALHSRDSSIPVRVIGDGIAPPTGTEDPDILVWLEEYGFVLVTNNRRSMPVHLSAHLADDRHVPGILQVPEQFRIGALVDHLLLRYGASLSGELEDFITYVHLDE